MTFPSEQLSTLSAICDKFQMVECVRTPLLTYRNGPTKANKGIDGEKKPFFLVGLQYENRHPDIKRREAQPDGDVNVGFLG